MNDAAQSNPQASALAQLSRFNAPAVQSAPGGNSIESPGGAPLASGTFSIVIPTS
jgi:hypothetical protein